LEVLLESVIPSLVSVTPSLISEIHLEQFPHYQNFDVNTIGVGLKELSTIEYSDSDGYGDADDILNNLNGGLRNYST
jgi:hypothetical protein